VFVSGTQVAISDIAEKLEITEKQVNDAIKVLKEKYSGDSGIQLLTFNKKIQFSSNPAYADPVSSVLNPIKERELSKSMLEVAAIIAYKQPVTRIDLEEIRGNSEYAIQKLLELGVIEPVGRKDAVGKPVLFGTTDKFLKRFQISSLDELPELLNILNGSLSLCGPRPFLVRDVIFMSDEQRRRHDVRPGLTGLAQVNGRNNITWEQKIEYDLEYIDKGITFIGDVKIILQTVCKVLKRSDTVREGTVSDMDFGDWLLQEGKVDKAEYDEKQRKAKEMLTV
jgi:segregation and condensation protein B